MGAIKGYRIGPGEGYRGNYWARGLDQGKGIGAIIGLEDWTRGRV